MTKQKKLEKENYIQSLFYLLILQRGYFDYWLDEDLFLTISQTTQYPLHRVRKIFFKDFYPNNKDFLSKFQY